MTGTIRFMTKEQADRAGHGERVVKCGACDHALEKKKRAEDQAAYCSKFRRMVSTWSWVLCPEFKPE